MKRWSALAVMIGRTYHRKYGYPWRWAVLAEVMWRLEHSRVPWVERWAYPRRKAAEHRGS
jgi:hypothetical protein